MTSITLAFSDYPTIVRGSPRLCAGAAEIQLTDTPRLPTCPIGVLTIPERPLQRPTRWRFKRLFLDGIVIADADDLCRWITGRYWHRIPRLLYAEFLSLRGLESHAQVYRLLGEAA